MSLRFNVATTELSAAFVLNQYILPRVISLFAGRLVIVLVTVVLVDASLLNSKPLAFKLILIFTVLISNLAKLKFGPTSRYLKELEDLTGLFLYKNTDLYKNKNISEYNPYLYNR